MQENCETNRKWERVEDSSVPRETHVNQFVLGCIFSPPKSHRSVSFTSLRVNCCLHHYPSLSLWLWCLQTTAWLCPGTDGLVCGTATGRKKSQWASAQSRLQFKCRGQTFDKFQYKACTIPLSLSMDMNFCQSLETLCRNFLKSVEFEHEGEMERKNKKRTVLKKKKKRKKSPRCACRHEKCHYLLLCCLGVMQINSGCLSRLNRDQKQATVRTVTRLAGGQQPQRK